MAKEKMSDLFVLQPSVQPQFLGNEENGYLKILQGNPTNELTRMAGQKTPNVELNLNDRAMIKEGALTVFIEKYSSLAGGLKPSTMKLLHAGVLQLTAMNHYGESDPAKIKNTVRFSLDEYMDLRALKDRKEARKQIKADLETLYNVSLEWSEKQGKEVIAFDLMRVFYHAKLERSGNIEMGFSPELAQYLVSSHVMYLPRLYWTLNDKRNPNSSSLLYKLALNQRVNRGRSQGNIIGVPSLLAVCAMPKYEELGPKGQVQQRIIDPFERDMHALEPTLTWEYCNKKGAPLTEEQLADTSYQGFVKKYVKYDLPENPEGGKGLLRDVRGE